MNIREGVRRLGIFVGVCGGILGGCLGYSAASTTWRDLTRHRQFTSLMTSPTMQRVTKSVEEFRKPSKFGGIRVVESPVVTYADGALWEDVSGGRIVEFEGVRHRFPADATDDEIRQALSAYEKPATPASDPDPHHITGAMLVLINLGGIREATVDGNGLITSIALTTGESVQRIGAPRLTAYLVILLYPVVGFLLPWGAVRVLSWVGSGFFTKC